MNQYLFLKEHWELGTLKSDKMMCYLNIYVIFILFKYFIKQNLIVPVFILFIYFIMEILCIKAYINKYHSDIQFNFIGRCYFIIKWNINISTGEIFDKNIILHWRYNRKIILIICNYLLLLWLQMHLYFSLIENRRVRMKKFFFFISFIFF